MMLRLLARTGSIGEAVAVARAVRLVSVEDALYAEVPADRAQAFLRALAYAGIAADGADAPAPDRAAVATIADRLDPLPRGVRGLDVLWVEAVPLAAATRRALGPRIARWLSPREARRARCRALLRGIDQPLAWERRAWISRADLADPRVRRIVRPIVFDRSAVQPSRRSHVCPRDSEELSRWVAG